MECGEKGRDRPSLAIICGPTASGKSDLALQLAENLGLEIISADSRQVYRKMDIGTAKATMEERHRVPHHLVDIVNPDEEFTAADFGFLGRKAVEDIQVRGRHPLVVGGTGFYLQTLTEGLLPAPGADKALRSAFEEIEAEGEPRVLHRMLSEVDPELAARLPAGDRVRIVRGLEIFRRTGRRLSELQREHAFSDRPFRTLKIGLTIDRDELYNRIDCRVESMIAAGLLEEARYLLQQYSPEIKALRTIGYRECSDLFRGKASVEETAALIQRNTRRYAKRQMTWFRRDDSIIWVDYLRESDTIQKLIEKFYAE